MLFFKVPGGDLLSHGKSTLSSAQLRFTALFGMGRGGSKALLPPSVTVVRDQQEPVSVLVSEKSEEVIVG